MNNFTRQSIAKFIYLRLSSNLATLKKQYEDSRNGIGYFYIDELLPPDLALNLAQVFPPTHKLKVKKNLREYKYVSAQINQFNPLIEELTFAFQQTKVVQLIGEIVNAGNIYPDENLYAGGVSSMMKGNYLMPHLDNSHDKDRKLWRVFNLLYYVSPNWELKNGGHLELWPNGLKSNPIIIPSFFNRLVVMATHQSSWHSVNKVTFDGCRNCVSNYYFSDAALDESSGFHVTTFRNPKKNGLDLLLKTDNHLRTFLRKFFKKGIVKTTHVYNPKTKDGDH